MKISIDVRFARLAGGGRVYANRLVPSLVKEHPRNRWRFYHNPWCKYQQELLERVRQIQVGDNIETIAVRSGCLSLAQHLEFLRFRDDAALYHYLHFDMPLGMRQIPLVITIHDLYPLVVAGYCSAVKRAYFHRIVKSNIGRAAKVIAISQHTKKDIIERFDIAEEKVTIIPQSHDPAYRVIEDIELLGGIREKYHLPDRFILYTGNHKPHKNLSRLIKAYGGLGESWRKEYSLVLTGKVALEAKQLLRLAGELGIAKNVSFIGWVDEQELPAIYNLASLTVLPSLYEGFGFATLESLACGTPVVCSSAGAISEVVGEAARMFDPYCIEEMAEAITMALEKDVDNPVIRAAGFVQAGRFSVEKTARATFELYRSAAL